MGPLVKPNVPSDALALHCRHCAQRTPPGLSLAECSRGQAFFVAPNLIEVHCGNCGRLILRAVLAEEAAAPFRNLPCAICGVVGPHSHKSEGD